MGYSKTTSPLKTSATPSQAGSILQRQCDCSHNYAGIGECEECRKKKKELQRTPIRTGHVDKVPSVVYEVLRAPGQPLDLGERNFMEPRFGHDFSRVRVHADSRAEESARLVNARAYTVGNNIVFGSGQYKPGTRQGQQLLAHELTHVVQQSAETIPSGDIKLGEPADRYEQEAERNSKNILSGHPMQAQFDAGADIIQRDALGTPPFLPELHLPEDVQTLELTETINAEHPKLIRLADAFKALTAAKPAAHIKLSAYLSEASKMDAAQAGVESRQVQKRMVALQQALAALGVPSDRVNIEPATSYSTKMAGQITASLYKSPRAISPFILPTPKFNSSPPKAKAGGGSTSLSDMLSFKFKAGPFELAVLLPKSIAVKLPVALNAANNLTFELKAETSGDFSFSIAWNGHPYVKVAAKAALKVDEKKGTSGSAGLEISTLKTVCNAPSPESLKTKITSSGEKLKKAMKELDAAESEERIKKLVDIAGAIGDMYEAVDKANSACKKVPRATFNIGVQGPLRPTEEAWQEKDPSKLPSTFFGGSITIPF